MASSTEYQRKYHEEHKAEEVEYRRQYRLSHWAAINARRRAFRERHRADIAEYKKGYRATHKLEIAEYNLAYRLANVDVERKRGYDHAFYEAHKEDVIARIRAYQHTGRGQSYKVAAGHRRKALQLGAMGADYTTADMIKARCELWGNRCYICGVPMQEIDHVKPLSKGGAHLPCNLRPVCKSCNCSKNDRWPVKVETAGRAIRCWT